MDWYQQQGEARTVLIFGDEVRGQLRHTERVLHDAEAYEAAQGYIYLKELIGLRAPGKKQLWLDFACLADLLAQLKTAEFCELGSTLFASIDKLQIAALTCSIPFNVNAIDFIGVELSPYFRAIAAMAARHPIRQFESHVDVPAPLKPRVIYSHFVGGYAFASAVAFGSWLRYADALLIAESFSIGGGDIATSVLGKRSTLFDFPALIDSVAAAGFRITPYHYRRVDLRGVPAIQVHLLACRPALTLPQHVVEAVGFDASAFANVPPRHAIIDRFRRAIVQEVEPPGASGFRKKN